MTRKELTKMDSLKDIEKFLADAKSQKHLTYSELRKAIDALRAQGKQAQVLMKVKESAYKAYLAKHPDYDPYEETLYITNTDQKAFNPAMGGYSIFATSIADMRRILAKPELGYSGQCGCDRIERAPVEWGIILADTITERK
jgi:hypothetical protein